MRNSPIIFATMLYKWMQLIDILIGLLLNYNGTGISIAANHPLADKGIIHYDLSKDPSRFHTILQIIILGHTLSIAVCVSRQMQVASIYPGHINCLLQKSTVWDFCLSLFLSYLWCGAFWQQQFYSMRDVWSNSYIGENISNLRETMRLLLLSSPSV